MISHFNFVLVKLKGNFKMGNYPTPLDTLGAFVLCFAAGVAAVKLYDWAIKKGQSQANTTS